MIRVNQVKLPISHSEADLRKKTAKMMGVSADQIQSVELVRQSLDARKKPDLYYLYALDVAVAGERGGDCQTCAQCKMCRSERKRRTACPIRE